MRLVPLSQALTLRGMMTDPTTPPNESHGHSGLPSLPFRSAALGGRKSTHFRFTPNAEDRAAIAQALGLIEIGKLYCKGEITPVGRHDYRLSAHFKAKVVQSCSITWAPVPAEVAEDILRNFIRDYKEPEGEEVEMLDESAEPLPEIIDVVAVVMEALELALPLYPRAPGAELGALQHGPEGEAPLRDEDLRPFSGLAGLAAQLKKTDEGLT